jgi:hypothetical protein
MREAVFLDDVAVFVDGVLRGKVHRSHADVWGMDKTLSRGITRANP